MRVKSIRRPQLFVCLVVLAWLGLINVSYAIPAFARQTGQACVACHVSFPELTPYGRMFKLSGYTIGTRQDLPLALMAQFGVTDVRNNRDDQGQKIVPKTDKPVLSAASVFAGGKITDNIGGWIQWTYNNLAGNGDVGHSGIDNTDLRIVGSSDNPDSTDLRWLYGLTVNNNPTVQDVWNSTPAFGFPFTTPPNGIGAAAATLLDGQLGQQVAGVGGYVYWKRSIYFELSGYQTADGFFSPLRAGQDIQTPGGVHRLSGIDPYWRLAYNHEWGANSLMVGTYGAMLRLYPDNTMPFTSTDRFTDIAIDAQFQHISQAHTYTFQYTRIHESQDYRASFPATLAGAPIGGGPTPANARDTLVTDKLKVTYYFDRKYGATLALVRTHGTADAGLYAPGSVGGSANGKPDTQGYILELDYLPEQNVRLMLQYYGYSKFNGARSNYDGVGRPASDNNTLFANIWLIY
ncbi:MAG: hypothetical protein ABI227_06555 [Rhodanobacter sp.]